MYSIIRTKSLIALVGTTALLSACAGDPAKVSEQAEKFKTAIDNAKTVVAEDTKRAAYIERVKTLRTIVSAAELGKIDASNINKTDDPLSIEAFAAFSCAGVGAYTNEEVALNALTDYQKRVAAIAKAPKQELGPLWKALWSSDEDGKPLLLVDVQANQKRICREEVKELLSLSDADRAEAGFLAIIAAVKAGKETFDALKKLLVGVLAKAEQIKRAQETRAFIRRLQPQIETLFALYLERPDDKLTQYCARKWSDKTFSDAVKESAICSRFVTTLASRNTVTRTFCLDAKHQNNPVCKTIAPMLANDNKAAEEEPFEIIDPVSGDLKKEVTGWTAMCKDPEMVEHHSATTACISFLRESNTSNRNYDHMDSWCANGALDPTGEEIEACSNTVGLIKARDDKTKSVCDNHKESEDETVKAICAGYKLPAPGPFDAALVQRKLAHLIEALATFQAMAVPADRLRDAASRAAPIPGKNHKDCPTGIRVPGNKCINLSAQMAEQREKLFKKGQSAHTVLTAGFDSVRLRKSGANIVSGLKKIQAGMLKASDPKNKDFSISDLFDQIEEWVVFLEKTKEDYDALAEKVSALK